MTIIVTGAAGFVGRHLVQALYEDGHDLVAVDRSAEGLPSGVKTIIGDIGSPAIRQQVFAGGCQALVHLATVPGGAAEADPIASRRINIDAMYDLLVEAQAAGSKPRVVYASSIAVFGDPLPAGGVNDTTPLAPRLIYGGHKAMMETATCMMHQRGEIEGISLRLPGIVARPQGPSGMKSAFMSNIFHAIKMGKQFVCPVSEEATIWAQSVSQIVTNFSHALTMDQSLMPNTRVVTLPAMRFTMGALANEIAKQCGQSSDLVSYEPDSALEAAFGAHPSLNTPAADYAGFSHDGSLTNLVASALAIL